VGFEMTGELILTLLLLAFAGSFLSGMLGIGGSIINYPMLLYIPALVGVAHFTEHEVAGMIAVQVFFSTLAGVVTVRSEKMINYKLVTFMGVAVMMGSFIGGYGGKFLSGHTINVVYAILATIAAIMMFIPKQGADYVPPEELQFNVKLAVLSAFIVGTSAGIVGAGGAFILVPIMLVLLKIPTRITIASSLAITFISSMGSVTGKLMAGHIPFWESVVIVAASVLAAPLGVKISKRMNTRVLKAILSVLILGTTIKIWSEILFE
jgi:uncharacterized membrane protein YfcA